MLDEIRRHDAIIVATLGLYFLDTANVNAL
jgi:hypothetical protein